MDEKEKSRQLQEKKKARQLYEKGYKYKDIHDELGTSVGTLKSWRSRGEWTRKKDATATKKDATKSKKVATQNVAKSDVIDGNLSPQQIRFADRYIATGNAKQSALDVGYSETEAEKAKSRLVGNNVHLKQYINDQVAKMQQPDIMSAQEIMQFLTDVIKDKQIETVSLSTPDGVEQVEQPADIKTKITAARELLKRYPTGDKLLEAKISKMEAEARIKVVQANEVEPDSSSKADKEFGELNDNDLRRLANNDGKYNSTKNLGK
ncbi:terminase small subunit [Apilactobacillus timberlakei]|uniref:terminase small subunit n=1 Tax=Apilactobacillus timberlakei TaxID=2008380 RepID=UPI00112D17BB|nr:terminase small subunit [Apilactobacillus timberlakei]TPR16660.1 hypothetical protein DYZ95_07400 [Apilactobacillus timberlakei]